MGNALSSRTTGDDIMRGKKLEGYTAVITGANGGIGREMTRQLARAGARVIMAVRRVETGEHVASSLRRSLAGTPGAGAVLVMECDLSSFASIRAFATRLQQQEVHLHILVLNAAIRACPKWYTREGFEMQMGVNYLGHWHLTELLLPWLQARGLPTRIVAVNCVKELDPGIRMNDLNFGRVSYDPFRSYKTSKVALTLFSRELARRLAESEVTVIAADPGVTGETDLFRFMGPLVIMFAFAKPFLKTLQQAVATPLMACTAPVTGLGARRRSSIAKVSGISTGALLSDCRVVTGNRLVNNQHVARRLWQDTKRMVGEAVVDSHVTDAGYGGSGSFALLFMDWLIKPLFNAIRRAFRAAAAGARTDGGHNY